MNEPVSQPPHPLPVAARGLDPGARLGIGLVLLLPAVLALGWSYLIPTLLAIRRSTTRDDLLGSPEGVGGANYSRILEDGFAGAVGLGLLLAAIPLFLAIVLAPALALLARSSGRRTRLIARILLTLPVAGYAPVAVIVGWRMDRIGGVSVQEHPVATLIWLTAVTSGGLVLAIATTAYLSALRTRRAAEALPAMLTVAGLLLVGVVAVALQVFTAPLVVGGSSNLAQRPPLIHVIVVAFNRFDLGSGSAGAVLLLVPLMLLGLVAVGLLLLTRARFEVVDEQAAAGSRPARVTLLVALLVLVAVGGWAAWPWLRRSFRFTNEVAPLPPADLVDTLVATWAPTLLSAVVAVGLAVVGGFAIGGLRPLGRFSEILLVPFAPWLFVGTGPLAIEAFIRTRDVDQLNTLTGLIPPGWVSIPALVAFTMLFRGLEPGWRAGGGFGRTMALPALPMAALAGLLSWLFSAGQVLWPWLVTQGPTARPAPLDAVLVATSARVPADELALGAVLPWPVMLLFLAALVGLQLTYLDRLALRVGAGDRSAGAAGTGRGGQLVDR
ncbi:sugar ABC transporter permease [Solwaraspora sp. WMMB335]|uniref:sugar ABC transporter permease n=1 Tax=Solwaraspora sp. WMMB335 TaxID=3404118 RepID=UPI003B94DD01